MNSNNIIKQIKKFCKLKKLKKFNFIDFAVPIIDSICPFNNTPNAKYSNRYFIICIVDFIDKHVSWSKYRGTHEYPINGKYLNQIHLRYCREGVYDSILASLTEKYLKYDRESKLKIQSADSSFIANKQGTSDNSYLLSDEEKQKNNKIRQENENKHPRDWEKESEFIDHNRYNGRKKYFKKDIVVDTYGYIFVHNTSSAKRHDSKSLNEVVDKLPDNFNTLRNSKVNRYKQIFLADTGYDSLKNRQYLESKGYLPLISRNRRNTRNKELLQANKMTPKEKQYYKYRIKVEHSFAWLKSRPIINQNYQKTITSYNGLFSLACCLINSKKI
jgi:IS5 family transposase